MALLVVSYVGEGGAGVGGDLFQSAAGNIMVPLFRYETMSSYIRACSPKPLTQLLCLSTHNAPRPNLSDNDACVVS